MEHASNMAAAVTELWMETFQLKQIGNNTNFFELGGNSLIAMDLMEKMSLRLGIELPAVMLFQNPTPTELAQCILALQYSGEDGNSNIPL